MSTLRSVDTSDVLRAGIGAALRDARVALPARIERYDATAQKVDVAPLLMEAHRDASGERQARAMPVISNVPVVFPAGGGFRLTFPLAKGDTVLLVFSDRSLDTWLDAGGVVDPVDPRMHHLSDAIAVPGLHDFGHPWTGARTDAVTLGKEGGTQLHIEPAAIRLGSSSAAQPLVQGAAFKSALDAFLSALSTFAGLCVGPNPGQLLALTTAITALTGATYLSAISRTD